MKLFVIVPVVIGFIAAFFLTLFLSPKPENWCEEKVIVEIVGCNDDMDGCVYRTSDESLDANKNGFKVGDKLNICRRVRNGNPS